MKSRTFFNVLAGAIAIGWPFASLFSADAQGQRRNAAQPAPAAGPKVEKIDEKRFAELLKPNGKPLLINFWATWCEPCRQEFPDLVKIDAEYKGKIDFITISLDFEEELATTVPKFLVEMKATMPTYLLVTADETAAIQMVSKDWAGALPFTVIYAPDGTMSYFHQGIVKYADLKNEIDILLRPKNETAKTDLFIIADFVKILGGHRTEALYFYENNWKIYRDEAMKRGVIESYELIEASSDTNSDFDLILITRYRGEDQFKNSEKNFEPILKELRPTGPMLKNTLKPEQFRRNLFYYSGRAVFSPSKFSKLT